MVDRVASSYDALAEEYARRIFDELKDKPFDRQLLDGFAERIKGKGLACDMGCGPGHVARYLHERGVDVFGLDLSAGMLGAARRLNPGLQFVQGSMVSLGLRSNALGGITALYSIIHLLGEQFVFALREFQRVLRPGAFALIAFHLGSEVLHENELWGKRISLDLRLFTTNEVVRGLQQAGFKIEEAVERDPYAPEVEYQSRRGYVLAMKPDH
ncbi:MAG TPA: class I SAM-dependent methyltransferase [Candidatus Acidoferrales bacterium]|nr:class I SAM-dependent methyltransferase [Candidatus Acidoferrales bacterium]